LATCLNGHHNADGQLFCGKCGAEIVGADQVPVVGPEPEAHQPRSSQVRALVRAIAPYLRVVAGMFAAICLWLAFVELINANFLQMVIQLVFVAVLGYLAVGKPIRDRLARAKTERQALAARADEGNAAYLAVDVRAFAPPPELPPRPRPRVGVIVAAVIAAVLVLIGIVNDISDGIRDPAAKTTNTQSHPPHK
jgi:hypothetical protein